MMRADDYTNDSWGKLVRHQHEQVFMIRVYLSVIFNSSKVHSALYFAHMYPHFIASILEQTWTPTLSQTTDYSPASVHQT